MSITAFKYKDYWWVSDGKIATLHLITGESIPYNKESLLAAIENTKKERDFYITEAVFDRALERLQAGLGTLRIKAEEMKL